MISAEYKENNLKLMLSNVLNDKSGSVVVWWILSMTGLLRNCFANDEQTTAFNCGRQSIGQEMLLKIMEAEPHWFAGMQRDVHFQNEILNKGVDNC